MNRKSTTAERVFAATLILLATGTNSFAAIATDGTTVSNQGIVNLTVGSATDANSAAQPPYTLSGTAFVNGTYNSLPLSQIGTSSDFESAITSSNINSFKIGDDLTNNYGVYARGAQGAGAGVFRNIYQVQKPGNVGGQAIQPGVSRGYNFFSDTPLQGGNWNNYDTSIPGGFDSTVRAGQLPVITLADNLRYVEFVLDVNENNTQGGVELSLDDFRLYIDTEDVYNADNPMPLPGTVGGDQAQTSKTSEIGDVDLNAGESPDWDRLNDPLEGSPLNNLQLVYQMNTLMNPASTDLGAALSRPNYVLLDGSGSGVSELAVYIPLDLILAHNPDPNDEVYFWSSFGGLGLQDGNLTTDNDFSFNANDAEWALRVNPTEFFLQPVVPEASTAIGGAGLAVILALSFFRRPQFRLMVPGLVVQNRAVFCNS